MKKLLLLLAVCSFYGTAQAQLCEPDNTLADTVLVSPEPLDTIAQTGDTLAPACINEPYELVFTFKVPDTIDYNGLMIPVGYLRLNTVGSLTGAPQGLSYDCNPPDCIFNANTVGCARLYGTPNTANTAGNYPLIITGYAQAPIIGELQVNFGGPGSLFPGQYTIELREQGECGISGTSDFAHDFSVQAQPNPFSDLTTISVKAERTLDNVQMVVTDLTGRRVQSQQIILAGGTVNNITFDGSNLPAGVYLCTLRSNEQSVVTRLVIAR